MTTPKTILVPTDFGTAAELALDRAVQIVRATQGRIVLVYACPLPYVTAIDGAMVPNGDVVEAMREAGRKRLAKAIERRKNANVEIRPLLAIGDPRTCILDLAKEIRADMIVMGTHGRSGLSRVFLGSTAESVVRTAPIPVLTIRATEVSA